MKPQNLLRVAIAFVMIPLGVYLAAVVFLGRIPANADWREPDTGVTIFVQTNGVHTGIVMPTVAQGVDWRARVPATDLADPRGGGAWLAFGWGDRGFYLDTPTWRQARVSTIARALTGGGATVMHVDHLDPFAADQNWRPVRLRPAEYRRLAAFVAATFADGHQVMPGYTPRDVFYAARGHYSALRTCNVWTSEALRYAGVRMGLWTPLAGDVMLWIAEPVSKTPRP
jgi:uncharacterized protein (TIGR02117 family)